MTLTDRLNAAAAGEIVWSHIGGACPTQGYGVTREGLEVYFRFRHNCAQLYVGADRDEPTLYAEANEIFTLYDSPDEWLGTLDDDQAFELVERLRAHLLPIDQWPNGTRLARMVRAFALLQRHLDHDVAD